ncbi:hypothetical protein CRM22_005782 [Opisthorchis felineus]|uniref:Bestrophin homolog n=1 Tax=Opisthorchis felineus TaxID=147828 RepID=A0A4S2LQZ2_OPIFE|nr:hypothetical protein CRM22_005782 [Opisthorchis felineus]TGZ65615.1 hypothetical protein CRM22_005782 [Opisthorchis felineus]TGZ65616.1 hypothetical protein CRM22_005782 [Opisthorchis felineus]
MTVQYSQLVLTGGPCVFVQLFLRWRGCVFKLIYVDIIVFLTLYFTISLIYRFALPEDTQRGFERLVLFIHNFQSMIPVSFILGFYVSLIFSRFWHQYVVIPWITKLSMGLTTHLPGSGERQRMIRRACVRYLLGSLILTFTRVNLTIKKRFPDFEAFIAAGLFTDEEVQMLEGMQIHFQPFAPVMWAVSLLTMAEKEQLITNPHALVLLIQDVNSFRQGLLNIFFMDYVCVPLVYTQVVTLSVYSYLVASLIGRQYIMNNSPLIDNTTSKDFYFPFFTLLELVIYVGWLKVAETLLNPMGEDDEDLDVDSIINSNWRTAWCIVDGMKTSPPAVLRDAHWAEAIVELPHTEESKKLGSTPYRGSVYEISAQPRTNRLGSIISKIGFGSTQDVNAAGSSVRKRSVTINMLRRASQMKDHTRESITGVDQSRTSTSLHPEDATLEQDSRSFVQAKGFPETITEEAEGEIRFQTRSDIDNEKKDPLQPATG